MKTVVNVSDSIPLEPKLLGNSMRFADDCVTPRLVFVISRRARTKKRACRKIDRNVVPFPIVILNLEEVLDFTWTVET